MLWSYYVILLSSICKRKSCYVTVVLVDENLNIIKIGIDLGYCNLIPFNNRP